MEEFELALDDCLRRLGSGKSSLAQCLARYPGHAAQLRPLLETAVQLQRGKQARPSGAARDRTRAKLTQYIQSHPRQPRNVRLVPRLTFAFLSIALAALMVGTAFAQSALPGQSLYGLKLSSERVWRAAAPNPVTVDIALANRRADEIVQLFEKNPATNANDEIRMDAEAKGLAAYSDVLERLSLEVNGPDDDVIITVLEAHQQRFEHAGLRVPRLDDIVANSRHGQGQNNGNGNGNGNKP